MLGPGGRSITMPYYKKPDLSTYSLTVAQLEHLETFIKWLSRAKGGMSEADVSYMLKSMRMLRDEIVAQRKPPQDAPL